MEKRLGATSLALCACSLLGWVAVKELKLNYQNSLGLGFGVEVLGFKVWDLGCGL